MEIIASVAGGLLVFVGALFVAGAVWSWFAARRMRNECAELGLYGEAILWRLIMKVGLIVSGSYRCVSDRCGGGSIGHVMRHCLGDKRGASWGIGCWI